MSLSSKLVTYYDSVVAPDGPAHLHRSDILKLLAPTADFQFFNDELQKVSPEARLLVLLRSLGSQQAALSPRLVDAELVVTFPGHDAISARHTLQVIRQMITAAKTEILVAGFAITEAGGVLAQLAEAARRRVSIVLVCSNWKDKSGKTAAVLTQEQWPVDAPRPRLYEYANDSAQGAGMHIKCLLADGADMLIGSANFTFPGLNTNCEMGVRLNGHVAASARGVFEEFLRTGKFKEIK
ncbi:MAG: hypothetical protein RIS76_4258 [Verrucomicrobiota bacterium]|jgi:phosphatidylserine/phosphatidylglycerophosphate/cardiolipin synthase-like enzyme